MLHAKDIHKEFHSLEEEKCSAAVKSLREVFVSGKSKPYSHRVSQMKALKNLVVNEEQRIIDALAKDLGRCNFEAVALEIVGLILEIDRGISELSEWMEPNYTKLPTLMAPATSEYVYEPYGVCLIIGAFNYPIMLTLSPLLGAIMAGNVVVLKPSEMCTECEKFLLDAIPRYMDNECYTVITGGISTTTALLEQRWDKIFFTGSVRVGKIVATAAAKHLTPTCLELGGKSPTIIDESVSDMQLTVQRILWGKFANAGQTCIAPDYILCHEKHYDEFLDCAVKTIERFYGKDPKESPHFGRIVSKEHCKRLRALIERDDPGRIVCGGAVDEEAHYVSPTVIADAHFDSELMHEEIFGPILPVIKVKSVDETIDIIRRVCDKPLALYIFGNNRSMIDRVTKEVTSGAVVTNDVMYHFGNSYIPFGGVGESGLGGYHGKFSFEAFSHRRAILRRDNHMIFDIPVRYPPYHDLGKKIFTFAAFNGGSMPSITPKKFVKALAAAAVAVAVVLISMKRCS